MTGSGLFREIGNISEEYVVEAENYKKQLSREIKILTSPAFRKTLAAAACLAVSFGLVVTVQRMGISRDSASGDAMENRATTYQMTSSEELSAQGMLTGDMAAEDAVPEAAMEMGEGVVSESAEEKSSGNLEEDALKDTGKAKESAEEEAAENVCEYPLLPEGSEDSTAMESAEAWSSEAVRERLSEYPNDYEALLNQENALIITQRNVYAGQDIWDDFRMHVAERKPVQIDIIRFTIEGDAIIETVYYDGEMFRLCVDYSRDSYRGTGDAYYEATYPYMQMSEQILEDGKKSVEYILTNSEKPAVEILESGNEQERSALEYYSIVYIVE